MKRSPSLTAHINHSLKHYPSLYGTSLLKIYNQIFVVNGNGLEWAKDGGIVDCCRRFLDKEPKKELADVREKAFELLAQIPEVTQRRVHKYENYKFTWDFTDIDQDDLNKWVNMGDFDSYDNLDYDVFSYLKQLVSSPSFYRLSLRRYSLLAEVPKNVKREYAKAIVTVLKAIVVSDTNEHNKDNPARAIIHLMKLRDILEPKCPAGFYPSQEEILDMLEKHSDRMLELDIKRHVGNYGIDESKINDAEYFELHQLSDSFLSPKEMALVRRYHQFTTWRDGYKSKKG